MDLIVGDQIFFSIQNLKMANGKTLVMKLTSDGDDMELWEILFEKFSNWSLFFICISWIHGFFARIVRSLDRLVLVRGSMRWQGFWKQALYMRLITFFSFELELNWFLGWVFHYQCCEFRFQFCCEFRDFLDGLFLILQRDRRTTSVISIAQPLCE